MHNWLLILFGNEMECFFGLIRFAWVPLQVNTITWKISYPVYVMRGPFLECPNTFATILTAFKSKYRKQKVVQLFGCKTFVYDED